MSLLLTDVTHSGVMCCLADLRRLQHEQPSGMLVFITVCECGYNHQQLMVVKVVVVMKNKYRPHFTIICTAASSPKHPHITEPLIATLHSWRINPDQTLVSRNCYGLVGITEKVIKSQ